jgi:hypothetical protein
MTRKLIAAAPVIVLLAGCSLFGEDTPASEGRDLELAHTLLDESQALTAQIVDAQQRLILNCVERGGHTVHDRHEGVMWGFQKHLLGQRGDRGLPWLPDREITAEWGLGVWTSVDDMYGSDEHREFEALAMGEVDTFAGTDNSAFEALDDADKFDWYAAYYGQERALFEHGHLVGERPGDPPGGLIGTVEPAGCMGEVTAALGLEPVFVPVPAFGDDAGTWSTFPPPPGTEAFAGALDAPMREARRTESAILDCLEASGWGRWAFSESGELHLYPFVNRAYYGDDFTSPAATAGVPEPPDDVPADPHARRAWEVAFMTDVHDCAEETGFAEDAEQAWNRVYGEYLLDLETEIYAWQEEAREIVSRAQELLGE